MFKYPPAVDASPHPFDIPKLASRIPSCRAFIVPANLVLRFAWSVKLSLRLALKAVVEHFGPKLLSW